MISNVTDWLEKAVERYPDKTVFWDENKNITYSQLHAQAKAIAGSLINRKIFKKPIAVYMDKSVDAIAAFWGIAYSGNFYSCIDIGMPIYKTNKILEVFKPEIVLTSKAKLDDISELKNVSNMLIFEDEICQQPDEEKILDTKNRVIDTDILYVIFTSGSTGVSKGVAVTHRSVINLINWYDETFLMCDTDIMGNQTPFFFALSVFDIFGTVSKGMACYIIPKELFVQPVLLLKYIKEKRINSLVWATSALTTVSRLRALEKVDLSDTLKKIAFCGEVMPNKELNIWRKYLPDVQYTEMYGSSEANICLYYIVDREFADDEALPLGRPTTNTDVMLLGEEGVVANRGVIGELCVRGTMINAGYYNDPQKTSEVFVQNPLNAALPEMIYRTGDMAKYNNNGELVYVSRKDYLIKHMGYRIELGEIETAASKISEVVSCCCLYDKKRSRIVMFLTPDLKRSYIRNQLSKMLPQYMLPNEIIILENMPITATGKIDRVKLMEML